ncbi:MarR family transcriptional regulator [Streptomyces sp. NPDC056670]|uniref:MarR family transcriptional regulator n=1 Tax=Streptomyces sp. NPDC056670 TaxID=3345904 RepID=UPI0036B8FC3F
MDRAGSSDDDSVLALAQQVSEAAEALIVTWNAAAQGAVPRLSTLQLEALLIARRSPGINLTGLAERIGAAPPAASRLCDRLEAAGLLDRRRPSTNRREIELTLTPHGRHILEALAERRLAAINQVLLHVPAAQGEALLVGLRAFTEAVQDVEAVQAENTIPER